MKYCNFGPLFIVLFLCGCAYRPGDLANPKEITLRQAVFDVADTLAATMRHTRNRQKVGLYVDEATVEFNVAASSTETDSLKVDNTLTSLVGVPLTLGAQHQIVDAGSRGNKITIKFKNVATLSGAKTAPPKVLNLPLKGEPVPPQNQSPRSGGSSGGGGRPPIIMAPQQ